MARLKCFGLMRARKTRAGGPGYSSRRWRPYASSRISCAPGPSFARTTLRTIVDQEGRARRAYRPRAATFDAWLALSLRLLLVVVVLWARPTEQADLPTPAPTGSFVSTPDHEFDFRGCASGFSVADSIDISILATPMNGAYCSADGMVFDGTDDYLDVTPWQFGGSITVEAFVKYASIPASEWLRIMCFSDSDGTDRVELTNQDGTGMARIVVRTGGTYYAHSSTSSSVFEVDKWAHIVATVEGTTAKIYVNGVLESTGSNVPEPGTATRDYHYIGGRVDNADSYFDGTIAYLRLWHG